MTLYRPGSSVRGDGANVSTHSVRPATLAARAGAVSSKRSVSRLVPGALRFGPGCPPGPRPGGSACSLARRAHMSMLLVGPRWKPPRSRCQPDEQRLAHPTAGVPDGATAAGADEGRAEPLRTSGAITAGRRPLARRGCPQGTVVTWSSTRQRIAAPPRSRAPAARSAPFAGHNPRRTAVHTLVVYGRDGKPLLRLVDWFLVPHCRASR